MIVLAKVSTLNLTKKGQEVERARIAGQGEGEVAEVVVPETPILPL